MIDSALHHTQCCIQLAQGKLSPEQLTEQVLSLVSTHSPRHLSDLSLSFEQRGDSRPSVEIVRMMQKLSDRAKHAQQCCSCVITCFKIAVVSTDRKHTLSHCEHVPFLLSLTCFLHFPSLSPFSSSFPLPSPPLPSPPLPSPSLPPSPPPPPVLVLLLQCLRQSYTSVVTADPFSILTQVLSSRYTDRYLLAKKFVSDCKLKPKEVVHKILL